MRPRVAALTATHRRINELIEDYGVEAFRAASEGILGYVERVLRSRLTEIPDGWWFAQGYLDHDGVTPGIYPLRCRVELKTGDRLVFDMTGTAKQAPAAWTARHGRPWKAPSSAWCSRSCATTCPGRSAPSGT